MKSWTQMALALGLAVSVTACAGDNRTADDPAMGRDTGAAVGTTGVGMGERNFIEEHVKMNEAEVAVGRLAQDRATNPQVREFAQAMVRDHQAALQELRQIAMQHNVTIEPRDEMEGDHRDLMERQGAEFDREFINWAVDKHEDAIGDVEDQVDSENQALRDWATKTLPTLRQHLDMARNLQQTLK